MGSLLLTLKKGNQNFQISNAPYELLHQPWYHLYFGSFFPQGPSIHKDDSIQSLIRAIARSAQPTQLTYRQGRSKRGGGQG